MDSDSMFEEKTTFFHRLEESETQRIQVPQVPHLLFSPSITPAVTPNIHSTSLTPNPTPDHLSLYPTLKASDMNTPTDFKPVPPFQDEDLILGLDPSRDDSIDIIEPKSFEVDTSLLSTSGIANNHAPTPLTQSNLNTRPLKVQTSVADTSLSKRRKPDSSKRKVLFQTPESTERDVITKPVFHPPSTTAKTSSLPHAPKVPILNAFSDL